MVEVMRVDLTYFPSLTPFTFLVENNHHHHDLESSWKFVPIEVRNNLIEILLVDDSTLSSSTIRSEKELEEIWKLGW